MIDNAQNLLHAENGCDYSNVLKFNYHLPNMLSTFRNVINLNFSLIFVFENFSKLKSSPRLIRQFSARPSNGETGSDPRKIHRAQIFTGSYFPHWTLWINLGVLFEEFSLGLHSCAKSDKSRRWQSSYTYEHDGWWKFNAKRMKWIKMAIDRTSFLNTCKCNKILFQGVRNSVNLTN